MDRRVAIKQMALLGAGFVLLPSCKYNSQRVSIDLNNLDITPDQEAMIESIVDTIIPTTETPGAKDLNVHHFLLRMVDVTHGKQDQKDFSDGMELNEKLSQQLYNSSYLECTPGQKVSIISGVLENKQEYKNDLGLDFKKVKKFMSLSKRYTIMGYMKSEYIMTEVFPYQLIPGHFNSCVEAS